MLPDRKDLLWKVRHHKKMPPRIARDDLRCDSRVQLACKREPFNFCLSAFDRRAPIGFHPQTGKRTFDYDWLALFNFKEEDITGHAAREGRGNILLLLAKQFEITQCRCEL